MQYKPPKFGNDGQRLIDLWSTFCEEIAESEYSKVPTQTEFCRWLSLRYEETDRKTIYNYLNKYFPTIKAEFEQIQSDTIASGAMLGKYQSTMSIFGLKNWCGWGDNGKTASYGADNAEIDPLTASLRELAEEMNADANIE